MARKVKPHMNSFVVRVLFYCFIGPFVSCQSNREGLWLLKKITGTKNSTDTRNDPEWGQSQAGSDRFNEVVWPLRSLTWAEILINRLKQSKITSLFKRRLSSPQKIIKTTHKIITQFNPHPDQICKTWLHKTLLLFLDYLVKYPDSQGFCFWSQKLIYRYINIQ